MHRRSVVVLAVCLGLIVLAAACGGDDEEAAPTTEGVATEMAPATTETEAETTEAATTEEEAQGDPEAGAEVFASAGCADCHTLSAAGSSGTVGPNLDDFAGDFDAVVEQVRQGGGGMPAFEGTLSDQEILDVAAFVVESASGGGGTTEETG